MKWKLWQLRYRFQQTKFCIFLLNYAHKHENIGTWKHDLIERIVYG